MITLAGCLARPTVKHAHDARHQQQNVEFLATIRSTAAAGDWLVTRGYHATDNLVANGTNTPISHAAVYDAEHDIVIEAEGKGIHVTPLAEFVDKSYRILIIRPRWRTNENAQLAVAEAEKMVGKDYDFLGTIGLNFSNKFYCSELAVAAYKPWHRAVEKFPTVIEPGNLYLYGQVLDDTMDRDEIPTAQVQAP